MELQLFIYLQRRKLLSSTEWLEAIPLIGNLLTAKNGDISFLESLPILWSGLTACIICSFICAFIGIHIIIRRIVFVSFAISQVSSLGLATALLIMSLVSAQVNTNDTSTFSLPGLLAVITALISSSLFAMKNREKRLSKESIIAIAYILPSASVFLILDRLSTETHLIENILFGNTVFVDINQLKILISSIILIFIIHILLFKKFIAVAFDYDVAKASGMNVSLYEQIFYFTLAVIISFAIGSIGILPVFGFMIIPAASALLLSNKMISAFILSVIIGVISASTGFYLSFMYSLPTGPAMLAVAGIILIFSSIFRFMFQR